MVGKRRKKALHKDFWQEIRKSRARFISIFCIVALGVAFFSGIQAASPDMRLSGDAYYNEASLMDLKVMATLGLTEDDVKAIQSIDGVESAEGAYSTDAICGENEKQKVLHIESMNQKVNQLTVTEGRLPEKSGPVKLGHKTSFEGSSVFVAKLKLFLLLLGCKLTLP